MTPLEDARARLEARIRQPWPELGVEPRPRAWGWEDGASVNDDDAIDTLIEAAKKEALEEQKAEAKVDVARVMADDVLWYCRHCDFEVRAGGLSTSPVALPTCEICVKSPPKGVDDGGRRWLLEPARAGRENYMPHKESVAMLERLRKYHNEPVMPMSYYCTAFTRWLKALQAREANRPADEPGEEWMKHIDRIFLAINKSSLLGRLLYSGERFRTRPCPKHKGKWSGLGECKHGCEETGWLPEPEP